MDQASTGLRFPAVSLVSASTIDNMASSNGDAPAAVISEVSAGAPAGETPGAGTPADPSVVVTPWEVSGIVDYSKLIQQFGSAELTPGLVARLERVTGRPAHHFLRRGIYFSHRDLDKMLDLCEAGQKFYLYTGRGPSSTSLHLGALHFGRWALEAGGRGGAG